MKLFRTVVFFLISLVVISGILIMMIFHYSFKFDSNLYDMASNNLESTYEAINQTFSYQLEAKDNDLQMINVYLNEESNQNTIKKYLKSILSKADIDNFYFVSNNLYYDIDAKLVENENSLSNYNLNQSFRFDGNSFYFILDVEPKKYNNIYYDKIAITYEEKNFLSNFSIKAYKKEYNSGLFLNDGRLLSTIENDFGDYTNIFTLLENFEFKKDNLNIKEEIALKEKGTYELKYNGTNYYLHFDKTRIEGVVLLGLVPCQTIDLSINKMQGDTIVLFGCFGGIVITIIIFICFIYYKKMLVNKNKELRIQNLLFQTISENMDDIFVLLDNKLHPTYVSPNSLRLIGVSPKDIMSNLDNMFECDDSNVTPLLHTAKELKVGQSCSVERRLKNKITGETYWCLDKLYHLKANGDDVYICILADRSKEKKNFDAIEAALDVAKQANQAKTSFLANMSHDLRTPMNAILGFSNLLLDMPVDAKVHDYALRINSSSKILMDLINDILDLTKIEAGKQTLNIASVSIDEIVKKVESIMRPLANKKNIIFNVYKKNIKHMFIEADSLKLIQVFTNVISNSIKYTNDGGLVTFVVNELPQFSKRVGKFEFIIEDNGIGMSDEFLNDIFLPFAREKDRVKNIQGTGLGMPIAKNIIDLFGGTINVSSKKGIGTKFIIKFDFGIGSYKENDECPQKIKQDNIALDGKRILVVEDNEINIILIKEILIKNGVNVDVALNGQEALNKIVEGNIYDCILMDVVMPVMNGYEATRKIRALGSNYAKRVPIIAMTANAFLTDIENAIKVGMNNHISKPIDFNKLLALLKNTIENAID